MKMLTARKTLWAATLAVALAGAWATTVHAQPMGRWHHGPGAHEADGPGGLRMGERMLDRVKATPEQRTQIRAIMEAARKDLQARREAGRGRRTPRSGSRRRRRWRSIRSPRW